MKTLTLLVVLLALSCAWAQTKDMPPPELGSAADEAGTDPLVEEMLKVDQCYASCRQDCILEIFSPKVGLDVLNIGGCFSTCGCMCNKACLDTCKQAETPLCFQNCGCPMNKTETENIVKQSDEFFKDPLGNKTTGDLWNDFNQTLSDTLDKKFGPTKEERKAAQKEEKEKQYLNKKLEKIERKWDEYVEQANTLGIDPVVFCNQTCSHDCFVNADSSQTPYDVLTGCLITTCKCFQPKLPKVTNEISFEALMVLKNIITSADEELEASSGPITVQQTNADSQAVVDTNTDSAKGVVVSTDAPQNVETQAVGQSSTPQSEPSVEAQQTAVQSTENSVTQAHGGTHQETENTSADLSSTVVAEQADAASATEAASEEEAEKESTSDNEEEEDDNNASPSVENAGHSAPTSATPIEEVEKITPTVATENQEAAQEEVVSTPKTETDANAEASSDVTENESSTPESPVTTSSDTNAESPADAQSEPTTASEASSESQSIDDAAVVAATDEDCDLKCFRECLEMKKFVPFPVIQQCIEVRCHCKLDENAEKIEAISALYNIDSLNSVQDGGAKTTNKPSALLVSILVLIIMAILGLGAYWVYRLINGDKLKFNRFYDDGEMVYTEEPGYERII